MATETVPIESAKPRRLKREARSVLTDDQREELAAILAQDDPPSLRQLAEMYETSISVVHRLSKQVGSNEQENTEAYGRRLAKKLPMPERVRIWSELARGKVDPRQAFVQKAALQRVEELIGHVTAKEKRESEANQSAPGPIFVFQNTMPVSVQPVTIEPDKSKT